MGRVGNGGEKRREGKRKGDNGKSLREKLEEGKQEKGMEEMGKEERGRKEEEKIGKPRMAQILWIYNESKGYPLLAPRKGLEGRL